MEQRADGGFAVYLKGALIVTKQGAFTITTSSMRMKTEAATWVIT